jgi:PIN domain nuclease of toxin-antitoxin system
VRQTDPARSPLLLLDTHVLVWLVLGERMLRTQAREAIHEASRQDRILVSAITAWEIGVLASKKRIDLHRDAMEWVRGVLSFAGVSLVPLEPEIAVASTCLPWEMHADPADRILVATARHLGATLVTADRALLEFARQGHFKGMDASA